MSTANYFETQIDSKGKASYLFNKRLNIKQGWFPGFKDRVKKKLSAKTRAEAKREALTTSNALAHLQDVCLRDSKGHAISVKDQTKAAHTWFEFVMDTNPGELSQLAKGRTQQAHEANEYLQVLRDAIVDGFNQRVVDNNRENYVAEWLTPFGDTLLSLLEGGIDRLMLSDALEIYLKQTQRDHLPRTNKAIQDITRNINYLISAIGDKPIAQISIGYVERYISNRLEKVKTTSVQREINSLRAAWHQCAISRDINQLNPFSNQPIKGLGTDSKARETPSLQQTQGLIKFLEERHKRLPDSYINATVMVAALTGSRLNEIWGLMAEDYIRPDGSEQIGVLHIRRNARRANLKTKNSVRPFPVLPELGFWLEILFKVRRPKNSNTASSGTLTALKKAGFTFGNHSLRHGLKQRLIELDTPSDTVDELFGWGAQRQQDSYGFKTVTTKKAEAIRKAYLRMLDRRITPNVIRVEFSGRP